MRPTTSPWRGSPRTGRTAAVGRPRSTRRSRRIPDSEIALLELATYYGSTGDSTLALEALAKASEVAPPRSPAHIRYAGALAMDGKPSEARAVVEGMTGQAPDYVPAWIFLAERALADGRLDDADENLLQAVYRDASNPEALDVRARIAAARGDQREAVAINQQLATALPGNSAVKLKLARSFIHDGDLRVRPGDPGDRGRTRPGEPRSSPDARRGRPEIRRRLGRRPGTRVHAVEEPG